MNTLAGIPNALVALVLFLIARTIGGAAAVLAPSAGFVLTFAAGMLLSAFEGMAVVPGTPLVQGSIELASGILLFSSAFLALATLPSRPASAWTASSLSRTLLAQALPAAGVLVPIFGNKVFPGVFAPETLHLGLVLALALWLTRQDRPLDLLMAAGLWLVLDFKLLPATAGLSATMQSATGLSATGLATWALPANPLPYILIIGSGSLIILLNRSGNFRENSLAGRLARDGHIALAVTLTIGFRLLGISWGLAALSTGSIYGLAGRNRNQRKSTASMQALAFESGLACAFAAGLGIGLAGNRLHLPGAALVASTALAVAAIRGLLSSRSGTYRERMISVLPASAVPLAMMMFTAMDSPALNSMTLGLVIASLAVLPAAGLTMTGATRLRPGKARWKPLVAVSRRGNATGILAFAHSLADPDQPIRSVCVAATPGSIGPDVAEAEETLVRAVAAGASKGYRILPSLVTADSTADGLARAALERRSDCILAGWPDNPALSNPEAGSVIAALVRLSPALVLSVRKPEVFHRAKRLVFVTMADSMSEEGYREAAAIAVTAWGRHANGMEVIVIGAVVDELASALRVDQGQIASIPAWRDLTEQVRRGGSQSLAFFVAAARPDWPGWNPGTERIPLVLADSFPESALAVFYLKAPAALGETAEDEPEKRAIKAYGMIKVVAPGQGLGRDNTGSSSGQDVRDDTSQDSSQDSRHDTRQAARQDSRQDAASWPPIIQLAIHAGRIMPIMKEAVLVDALSTLTKAIFPGDKTAASRMASDFSTAARTEPIELAPGILLLHAHAKGIAVPALAIGVNRDGWRLVALDEPVRIIIMLVSPVEAGPAAHLEALTQIAKAIRDHGFALAILDPERCKEFSPDRQPGVNQRDT